jgi:multidrug efflux pump subunit AcrB
VRFRPIILTSITTFLGLTPMMLDNTTSTIMFSPMAVSLAFGVLLGTGVTLFLVPCLYMILEDLLILTGMHKSDGSPQKATQASGEVV